MSISARFRPLIIQSKPEDSFSSSIVYDFKQLTSGFIQPVSSSETFSQMKSGENVTHRMYCPLSCNAAYSDRINWNGQYYIVVSADQPEGISSTLHHKEILIQQVIG